MHGQKQKYWCIITQWLALTLSRLCSQIKIFTKSSQKYVDFIKSFSKICCLAPTWSQTDSCQGAQNQDGQSFHVLASFFTVRRPQQLSHFSLFLTHIHGHIHWLYRWTLAMIWACDWLGDHVSHTPTELYISKKPHKIWFCINFFSISGHPHAQIIKSAPKI